MSAWFDIFLSRFGQTVRATYLGTLTVVVGTHFYGPRTRKRWSSYHSSPRRALLYSLVLFFIDFHLLKPLDMRLMVNEVDTLPLRQIWYVQEGLITFILCDGVRRSELCGSSLITSKGDWDTGSVNDSTIESFVRWRTNNTEAVVYA